MHEKHFHKDAMSRGLQRVNPIPTKRGPHCGRRQLNEPNIELEGKYAEWPNPQKAENHACDRQSGINDSALRNRTLVA